MYIGKKAIETPSSKYISNDEKRDALALEPIPHSLLSCLTVGEHQEWPKADPSSYRKRAPFCNSISIRSALLVFTVIGLPIIARLHMQAPRGRNIRQRLNASIYANVLRRKRDHVSDLAGAIVVLFPTWLNVIEEFPPH